jgi:protocatechuate 3,4-dioxygenase beta subunit
MRFRVAILFIPVLVWPQGVTRSGPPRPSAATAEITPSATEDLCTVEGHILNSATGEPLRKASVVLRRAGGDVGSGAGSVYGATSDAAGYYVISGVEPGQYRLMAERNGFVPQQYGTKGTRQPGTILTLTKAQRLKDMDFRLIAQGVITGRVVDEDGDPVQNVMVNCVRQIYSRGRKQWMPTSGQMTNDLGEYRMHGLAPGRYYLSATFRPGFMEGVMEGAGADESYAPTYYPGASSPETASPLDITPGAQLRGVDVHLHKTRTVRVRGRVTLPGTGKGPRNTMIRLMSRSDSGLSMFMPRMSRVTSENGNFVITGVTPGSYWIIADSSGEEGRLSAKAPIDVGSGAVDDVVLALSSGVELHGSVKVAEGMTTKTSNARVQLEPKADGLMMGPAPSGAVSEDGKFTLRNVLPDAYSVRVYGLPDDCYVKSVQFGDADVTDTGIDFSNAVAAGEFVVTVSTGAPQLTGAVQDGRQHSVTSAYVVLIPEGKRRESQQYYKLTSTDQNGQFTIKGIVPGEYRAYAFDEIEPGAYMDPEFMKPFESKGERVSLRENGRENLQLKLIATTEQR